MLASHRPLDSKMELGRAADGKLGRLAGARPRKALSATAQSLDLVLRAVGSKEVFQQKG